MKFDHSPYQWSEYCWNVLGIANARAERWRKRYVSALARVEELEREVEVLTKAKKPAKVKPVIDDENPMKETED